MKVCYAFFDVDETLVRFKTTLSFYEFWQCMLQHVENKRLREYDNWQLRLERMEKKYDREKINRNYHLNFKDTTEEKLSEAAEKWWKKTLSQNDIFHEEVIGILKKLKNNGVKIVLVSGAMACYLKLIQVYVGADALLAAQLEVVNGVVTGKILPEPVIGLGKVRAIQCFLEKQTGIPDFENSYAFGDHETDKPMLQLVGNPYWVIKGKLCQMCVD